MISLRHFEESDAEILRQKQFTSDSAGSVRALIKEWNSLSYQGRYFEMFAIVCGGAVVGSVSLYEHSRRFASVGVEIFPEERRKGYAAQGMKLVFEIAKGRGYRVIQDQVAADNGPSIALHEKLGFETDGYEYTNKRDRRVILYSLCL